MTREEQQLVLKRDFDKLWSYADNKEFSRYKESCKKKFNEVIKLITRDSIKNYKELIWDLPKGRQDKAELNLDTAIRETHEEIGLSPKNFRILFDRLPIITTYIDYNVMYKMTFYVAEYSSDCDEVWNINSGEIDKVEWWPLSRVVAEFTGPLYESVVGILESYIEHTKKNIHYTTDYDFVIDST